MVIPVSVCHQVSTIGVLSSPMFYLSAYLEEHRDTYYYRLQAISEADDWNGWVAFFLTALVEQAHSNSGKTRKIMALYERMKLMCPRPPALSTQSRLLMRCLAARSFAERTLYNNPASRLVAHAASLTF